MNDLLKRRDSLDEDLVEAMRGRCDFEVTDNEGHERTCLASATKMIVLVTDERDELGDEELLSCDEHFELLTGLVGIDREIDSVHEYEHRCAPVYAADRGDVTVYTCDCGHVVGVE